MGKAGMGKTLPCFNCKISESTKNKYQLNQHKENETRNHAQSQQRELTLHNLRVNPLLEFLIAHCIPELLIHKENRMLKKVCNIGGSALCLMDLHNRVFKL